MSFWLIVLGVLLILIGFSVWWDDKEISRQIELEEVNREHSPELYDTSDDDEFNERYGSLAPYIATAVLLFYALRGVLTAIGGVWLVVGGVN
jgi:hypothetical protein